MNLSLHMPREALSRGAPRSAAAAHAWMGKPLDAYPDGELRLILAALEETAFGQALDRRSADRTELLEAIAQIDVQLGRKRGRSQ